MLPIIPISLLIIKVSCIYMHISVSFTFFADTEGTTAYGPTTLCGALAITRAYILIRCTTMWGAPWRCSPGGGPPAS